MSGQLPNKSYSVPDLSHVNFNSSQIWAGTTSHPIGPQHAIPRFSTLDPTAASFIPSSRAPSAQASNSQTPSSYFQESGLVPRTPDNTPSSLGARTTSDSSHFPGSRPSVIARGTQQQVLEFRTQQSDTPHILFSRARHGAADDYTELPITSSSLKMNRHHPSHDHHANHSQQRNVFGQTQTSTNYSNHGHPWNLRDWRNGGLPGRTGHANKEVLIHGRDAARLSPERSAWRMGPSSKPEGSFASSPSTQHHTTLASQGQEIHDSSYARRGKENAQAADQQDQWQQQAQTPLHHCRNAMHQSKSASQAPLQEQTQVALSQTSSRWPCSHCKSIGNFAAAEMEVQTLRDKVQKQQEYLDDARAKITTIEGRLRAQAQLPQQLPRIVHPILRSQDEERPRGDEWQEKELQNEEHPPAMPDDSFLDDDDIDGGVSLPTSDDTQAGWVGN
ncbi:hypothetical protein K505DRAFT_386548 [Melanomma pulvis-pyrius CBS 109.77]|uniref:Uncharacterized protein n=1 Tax=Melanomma pulvis-pyrius CBS 109.77 TaxID=1314802 RepID=A0A6A6XW50_9PLEO|nr:hypothetical protein K505DRAFT_386548 [Melanomma pulvis-pyrius CBS 109.77]